MPIIGIGRKSALRIYWPVRTQGIGGGRKSALRLYFWSLLCKLHAWIHGTPDTPEFFAKQKMRPNKVLKKPSPSVDFL
jgi:hypothetical protein